MASRRWQPGELIFQGGTSLHLAHGSPRFSEDLDFLVNSSLNLDFIGNAMRSRLENAAWLPKGIDLTVGKSRDGHNPHAFFVSLGGANVIGAVRVKVELWQAKKDALSAVKTVVAPVRLVHGPVAGIQTFVPTAHLAEIYADKVFALAARPYLKARDVFDLHWLHTTHGPYVCSIDDLRVRLDLYPNETPLRWLEKAFARRKELLVSTSAIASDLARWLPSSWPLTEAVAKEMVQTAVQSIERGIDAMRELARCDDTDLRRIEPGGMCDDFAYRMQ